MNGLNAAIYARWNVAGLNTSIATLYPAGDKGGFNPSGTREKTPLPRAEYFSISPGTDRRTRTSLTNAIPVYFRVYGTSAATVQGWVDSIRAKYVNAEHLVTPASSTVLDIKDGGSFVSKQDDAVWMGEQMVMVTLRSSNTKAT